MGRYSDPKKYKSGGNGKMEEYKVPSEGGTKVDLFMSPEEKYNMNDKTRVELPEVSRPVMPPPSKIDEREYHKWKHNIPDTEGLDMDIAQQGSLITKKNLERFRLSRQRISNKKKSKPLEVAVAKPKTY